jgi:hypothetical protein
MEKRMPLKVLTSRLMLPYIVMELLMKINLKKKRNLCSVGKEKTTLNY